MTYIKTISLYISKYWVISLIARCNWAIPLSFLLLQHQLLIPGLLQSSVLKLIDPLLCSLINSPLCFLKLVPLLFELHLEKESIHVGEYFFFINYLLCCIVETFFLVCAVLKNICIGTQKTIDMKYLSLYVYNY